MSEDEDNGKAETTVIDKGIDKEIKEKRIEECIHSWKSEKRSAKSRMTRLLNHMAAMILDGGSEPSEIKDLLLRIDEQKEETLDIMNNLEKVYMEKSDQVNATKVSDEADALVDQVDSETGSARVYLMSLAKKLSHLNSVTVRKDSETKESEVSESQKRKEESRKRTEQWVRLRKERMEMEVQKRRKELQEQERQLQELREVEEDENRSQELNEQDDGEMVDEKESVERKDEQNDGRSETQQIKETNVLMESPEITTIKDKPSTKEIGAATPQAQLERIRIPVFSGNKMEFQKWHAAFTSCVDLTSLSPQFKMLRLEASLTGEAADTIKGLGYSEEAYKAAKARLVRKYGGSRRQVQSHLEELKKLKPIEENNSKELEKFADILERAVITLKENGRESDLESGVLHTIIVEKIPERLLAQYYRWIKENHHQDSLEKLKDWVAEEAEYQIHATEIRKGIGSDSEKRKDRKPRLYFNRDGDTKERSPCPVCSGDHPIWKCNDFRNHSIDEKWKIAKKAGLCYKCLGKGHLGGSCT